MGKAYRYSSSSVAFEFPLQRQKDVAVAQNGNLTCQGFFQPSRPSLICHSLSYIQGSLLSLSVAFMNLKFLPPGCPISS